MIFHEVAIQGAFRLEVESRSDERGLFARIFCAREFAVRGVEFLPVQGNRVRTRMRATVRGLHYQVTPHAEAKLVTCVKGAVLDVGVDLRPESPTYLRHAAVELNDNNRDLFYLPAGCAHGYQSLCDETELIYLSSAFYHPESERGIRPEDPQLGIRWPLPVAHLSAKDMKWPAFNP